MKFKIRNITEPLSVILHASTWLPKPRGNWFLAIFSGKGWLDGWRMIAGDEASDFTESKHQQK